MYSFASCTKTPEERHAEEAEKIFTLNVLDAHGRLEYFVSEDTDRTEADELTRQYYSNFGDWLWAETPQHLEKGHAVLSYLEEHVPQTGFSPDAFYLKLIADDLQRLDSLWFDKVNTPREVMARLEYHLTKAYVRYARGQRYGFTNPKHIYKGLFDAKTEEPDSLFLTTLVEEAVDGKAPRFLALCEPTDTVYRRLQKELANDSVKASRLRLLCNLERRRWRDAEEQAPDGRYVLVNLPAQKLWAVSHDSVFSMRICCGAFKTKTPTLSSGITRVEFNPNWNIPMSILRNEISHHAGDSNYFTNRRYSIVDTRTGKTVSGSQVSAAQLSSGHYRVSQQGGAGNSLGRIIFRFPNHYSVYLHDTNNRSAFKADKRTISHGCVRVERPFDLVKFVLPEADEWELDRMRMSIDMKPESQRGKDFMKKRQQDSIVKPVRLVNSAPVKPNVPVYLQYYTVYPNPETGVIETWPDRYEYDKPLEKALSPYLK